MEPVPPHSRFGQALVYTAEAHTDQTRKISGVPFVAHLLDAASLSLEYGATENEVIATLVCG